MEQNGVYYKDKCYVNYKTFCGSYGTCYVLCMRVRVRIGESFVLRKTFTFYSKAVFNI